MFRRQKSDRHARDLTGSRFGSAVLSLLLTSAVAHGATDMDSAAVPVPPADETAEQAARLRFAFPDAGEDRFIARGQVTYAWTRKFGFNAPYTGPQSLVTN